MITQNDIQRILGTTVYDADGDKIGSAGQVYLDNQQGNPEWVSVHTGMFGTKESFVPLQGARLDGDRLEVAFGKERVKDAPRIDVDGELTPAEESELYTYYGLGGRGGDAGYDTGYDTSGPTTDTAMTRSEEHLVAGTRSVEVGKARLRKYVVTEQQSVDVPVYREQVRLEREPITDANIGAAMSGPDISEEEHEVVLRRERAEVDVEAVPVERVRLGKETITEQQTVSGEVRKEQIEFQDETVDAYRRDNR